MPRTLFGPQPARGYGDDPQRLRKSAESKHRHQEEFAFLFPLEITAEARYETTGDPRLDTIWRWTHPYFIDINYEKRRDELTAEDYRRFCFKDCALYSNQTSLQLRRHLFERIYRRWFPTRAEDVDISHRSFFCELIEYDSERETDEPSPTLADVLAFHKELCLSIKQAVPKMNLPQPARKDLMAPDEEHALLCPRADYKLRSSFERCFIYVHAEGSDHSMDSSVMKKRGTLVVFLHEAYAAEHNCTEDQEGITRMREEEQGLHCAAVFRCDTIERAMRVLLFMDPERIKARQERHGYYHKDDPLDSSPDTPVTDKLCTCRDCREAERTEHA